MPADPIRPWVLHELVPTTHCRATFIASLSCRDGRSLPGRDQSFRDFMEGKLQALPGELATMKDWELHLGFMYQEVCSACASHDSHA